MKHTSNLPPLSTDDRVSRTVYSAVWPETEALVRECLQRETEMMLSRHRDAYTKAQDPLHEAFFEAWQRYATPSVKMDWEAMRYRYPTAGSSEAIREIIRSALWQGQDLVVFDGEYEGYEAIAIAQGTVIHRVKRETWRETFREWVNSGTPWQNAGRKAQWWISQPSAIDGNIWKDFHDWLTVVGLWKEDTTVWVDLCYLGVTTCPFSVNLTDACVGGVVFSLSKTMGAYYRRIGGCLSRQEQSGLWGNGWFKNLDSLYLGTRWLNDERFQGPAWRHTLAMRQGQAMDDALNKHRATFTKAGIVWKPSDVALLMHADTHPKIHQSPGRLKGTSLQWWNAAARGETPSGRRLCLTPSMTFEDYHGTL